MEIVLGIDNIIFISLVAGKLPEADQPRARTIGLLLALVFRILLLLSITWVVGLKAPLFTLPITPEGWGVTGRDLILLGGGLFLIWKSTTEVHDRFDEVDDTEEEMKANLARVTLTKVIVQIVLVDIVFSFDSILTAVGLAREVLVMILAVILSMGIMLAFSGAVSNFVNRHPTVKMLALSFLIMIGMMLVAEGLHQHIPKGYIYFAMAFSLLVESLNLRLGRKNRLAHEARQLERRQRAEEADNQHL
ncbi:MAG: TerC family protein [Hymenobacteraceae bacterium]|nr:TerC family protein [Hymenobacteraceae bacterium]